MGFSNSQGHAEPSLVLAHLLLCFSDSAPPTPRSSCFPALPGTELATASRPLCLSFPCKSVALPGGRDPVSVWSKAFGGLLSQICHFSEVHIKPQRRECFKVMRSIGGHAGPRPGCPDSQAIGLLRHVGLGGEVPGARKGQGGRWTPLSAAEKSSLVDVMRERAQPSGWNRLVATCPRATPSATKAPVQSLPEVSLWRGKQEGWASTCTQSKRAQSGLGPSSIASFFSHSVFRCFLSHSQRSYPPSLYTPICPQFQLPTCPPWSLLQGCASLAVYPVTKIV